MIQRAAGRSAWIDADGGRVHARVWNAAALGGPTPLVLVHGLVISSRYMRPIGSVLGRWMPTLAPDLPGFGRSAKPERALDVEELADALAATVAALGIPRASFLGNSLGCQVVAALAQRHPELVDRLVLVGPTVDRTHGRASEQLLRLVADIPRESWRLPLLHVVDQWRAGVGRTFATIRHALDDHIEDRLPEIGKPTLVVRGENDPLVSEEWARRLARLAPGGTYAEVPDAPHALNYSSSRRLGRLTLPFLRAPRSASAPDAGTYSSGCSLGA